MSKLNSFTVYFLDGEKFDVKAIGYSNAAILASANRILNNKPHAIEKVTDNSEKKTHIGSLSFQ